MQYTFHKSTEPPSIVLPDSPAHSLFLLSYCIRPNFVQINDFDDDIEIFSSHAYHM